MSGRISGESAWRRVRTVIVPTPPAAGAEWLATVPAGHVWRIVSVHVVLTTSAVVNTRIPRLILTDSHVTYADIAPAAGVAASITRRLDYWPDGVFATNFNSILGSMPDVTLTEGWTIGSATDLIDVGDQYSAIALRVDDTTARLGPIDLNQLPDFLAELVEPGPTG